jgi:hypothetical protein
MGTNNIDVWTMQQLSGPVHKHWEANQQHYKFTESKSQLGFQTFLYAALSGFIAIHLRLRRLLIALQVRFSFFISYSSITVVSQYLCFNLFNYLFDLGLIINITVLSYNTVIENLLCSILNKYSLLCRI